MKRWVILITMLAISCLFVVVWAETYYRGFQIQVAAGEVSASYPYASLGAAKSIAIKHPVTATVRFKNPNASDAISWMRIPTLPLSDKVETFTWTQSLSLTGNSTTSKPLYLETGGPTICEVTLTTPTLIALNFDIVIFEDK